MVDASPLLHGLVYSQADVAALRRTVQRELDVVTGHWEAVFNAVGRAVALEPLSPGSRVDIGEPLLAYFRHSALQQQANAAPAGDSGPPHAPGRFTIEGTHCATHVVVESGQANGRLWCGRTWFLEGGSTTLSAAYKAAVGEKPALLRSRLPPAVDGLLAASPQLRPNVCAQRVSLRVFGPTRRRWTWPWRLPSAATR